MLSTVCLLCVTNCVLYLSADHSLANKRIHITKIIRKLPWLPVRQRVDFKLLMFRDFNGLTLQYLSDDSQILSATSRQQPYGLPELCAIASYQYSSGFYCCSKATMEQCPAELRQPYLSCAQFRLTLKTNLFC